MKQIFIISLLLIAFTADAQKRIRFFDGIQKCLDINGDPVENCFAVSNSDGKFRTVTLDEVLELIMLESEGSVDSIWVDGDSLRVVFFDSPSIAYYAPGLNGMYSTGNNNKQVLVNTVLYPPTGSGVLTWQTQTTGLAKIQMNTNSNTPLTLTGQTSEGRVILGLPSTNDQSFISLLGDGETWKFGNNNGAFNFTPRQFMSFPTVIFDEPTSGTSNPISQLRLHSDTLGTISMSGYNSGRPFSSNPINFAAWDTDGKLQKYDISTFVTAESNFGTQMKIFEALGSSIQAISYGDGLLSDADGGALSDKSLWLSAIWLEEGMTANGVKWFSVFTGDPSANANNNVALYSYSAGTLTRVAVSNNDNNLWVVPNDTYGTKAFSSSYEVPTSGVYFIGVLFNGSIAQNPTIGTQTGSPFGTASTVDFTNDAKLSSTIGSQNTMPLSVNMSSTTEIGINLWLAIY